MPELLQAHGVDFAIIAILAYYGYDGTRRGALVSLTETAGFFVSLLAATALYRFPAGWIESGLAIPRAFAAGAAFFALWWAIGLAWPWATSRLRRRLPAAWVQSRWNRRLGFLPSVVNAAVLLSVFLTVALSFPLPSPYKRAVAEARLAQPLLIFSERLDRLLRPVLGPLAEEGLRLMTVRPDSGERVDLHFTVHDGTVDEASARLMLDLVNEERRAEGLPLLDWSEELAAVGRSYSRQMLEQGFFSHVDPEGRDARDRATSAGVRYLVLGENLALAPDVGTAHRGLMDSPGHRANILRPEFGRIGIGVIDAGVYGKMFTQMFGD